MYCNLKDYDDCRALARHWARVALWNKRDGIPWQEAAAYAHQCYGWAMLVAHGKQLRDIEVI